jgi:HlyD family secretion protein
MPARTTLVFVLAALLGGCADDAGVAIVGTLERDRIELTATYAEPIAERFVQEGDRVKVNTVVVTQKPERLDAQLQRAVGERDQLAARLAELVRGPRAELIDEAVARLERTKALQHEAQLELQRITGLHTKGFASAAELDVAKAQSDSATASAKEAAATLSSLHAGTTAEELLQAHAAVNAADANVAQAKLNLDRLRHIAPDDTWVEALPFEVGEIPPVGAPVAVLLRDHEPYARVYVPEPLHSRVRPGETVSVAVDGIAAPFAGKVRYVSADASFTPYFALTRHDRSRLTYLAEIDLSGATALPSGTPVEVTLTTSP